MARSRVETDKSSNHVAVIPGQAGKCRVTVDNRRCGWTGPTRATRAATPTCWRRFGPVTMRGLRGVVDPAQHCRARLAATFGRSRPTSTTWSARATTRSCGRSAPVVVRRERSGHQRPPDLRGARRGHRQARPRTRAPHPDCAAQGRQDRDDPLAPRTARAIDLAIGERLDGPIFLRADGQRMDRHCASRIVRRGARRARLDKKISPHTLPHAFITAVLDADVPLRDVQEAASHADPRTTMRYDRARVSLGPGTPPTSSPPTSPAQPADSKRRGSPDTRRPAPHRQIRVPTYRRSRADRPL